METLALSPRDAAAFLAVSKRTLTRLIADKKIEARKSGPRTLVDVASLKAYYASLPKITRPAPLYCAIPKPKARPKAKQVRSKTHH
jgi:excisionase family DNA binding protein